MERFHPPFHKWWLNKLDLADDSKVLDVGCGTGWASRMVAKMVTNGEVVGVDFVEDMIAGAKLRVSRDSSYDYNNLRFEVADVTAIPYPDDYFDCLICVESFSWYPNPAAALREMKRVLKPEGKLYVADAADSRSLRLILKVWKLFVPGLDKWNIYSESQFKKFIKAEFADVYQKKASSVFQFFGGRVLLTVGTKAEVDRNV